MRNGEQRMKLELLANLKTVEQIGLNISANLVSESGSGHQMKTILDFRF
jgi:hypothetical protein